MKLADQIAMVLTDSFGDVLQEKDVVEVIKATDEELMMATHVVYEPNVPDAHGEWMDEETVRKACHSYNQHCQKANLFHRVETDKVDIVESYILPVSAQIGDKVVQKGTWISVLQYKDAELWDMQKSGEIQGVSLGAKGKVGA